MNFEANTSHTPQPEAPAAASSSLTAASGSASFQVAPSGRHRKVAIVGFGRTAKDCPWQDPSWELWALNGFWRAAEPDHGIKAPENRYTLWLDMHTIDFTNEYGRQAGIAGQQEQWLQREHPFPILMLEQDQAFPSSVRFPIEDVIRATGRDYFTSGVAYALAFALFTVLTTDDIAEVGLWGIDLTHKTEYMEQRPCAEYWLGRLEAAGVKVVTHQESALLNYLGRYGYVEPNPLAKEMRAMLEAEFERLTKAMQANQAEMERLRSQLHTDDGAMQLIAKVLERLDVRQRGGKL